MLHVPNGHLRRVTRRLPLLLEELERRDLLAFNPLVISEVNYHPAHAVDGAFVDEMYEFVELYNAGTAPLNLAGVNVRGLRGTTTTFVRSLPDYTLAPGEFALVVRDVAAMISRYGHDVEGKIIATYAGELSNFGSDAQPISIRLATPGINQTVVIASFDDGDEYPESADGFGATLVLNELRHDVETAHYADPNIWRASVEYGGSPGRAGESEYKSTVVINEMLANSNNAINEVDRIELANVSNERVDLGGWILTDHEEDELGGGQIDVLHAYVIPSGTILNPGEYLSFSELEFNPAGQPGGFGISSFGERLSVISREADGTRYLADTVVFGRSRTSQSIGRAPNPTGGFVPLVAPTFGAPNSDHVQSPIVITEIMYRRSPPNGNLNYVEIFNRTAQSFAVGESIATNRWRMAGADFWFPTNTVIPAQTAVLIVAFSPTASPAQATAFRNTYGIEADVRLFGPFSSNLSDNGEPLTLWQPYVDGVATSHVLADSVDFNNSSPWPEGPDGGIPFGAPNAIPYSLNRLSATSIGDLPHSWRGALPSPGTYAPVPAASPLDGLVISEFSYNPLPAGFETPGQPLTNNSLEFIELLNTTDHTLDLTNAGIGDSVDYRFPINTFLARDERVVVVPFDPTISSLARDVFLQMHGITLGDVRLFGPWQRSLSKGGEHLALVDGLGNTFFELIYDDEDDWPERPDGRGSTLELVDPSAVPAGVEAAPAYLNDPDHWRASHELFGTPGRAGAGVVAPSVVINEVLANSDEPFLDAVELVNVSKSPVSLGGWLLIDDMTKDLASAGFVLPNVTLHPGDYITFDASTAGFGGRFALDGDDGERLYLVGRDLEAQTGFFADDIEFPVTLTNLTLGRWPNGTGRMFPMRSPTLGLAGGAAQPLGVPYSEGANSGPVDGDVVISEFMYAPGGANAYDYEYVELFNRSMFRVNLGPLETGDDWTENTPQGWRIKGSVDFEFTAAHSIAVGDTLVVVGFDPADEIKRDAFRLRYGIDASVQIVGPFERLRALPDAGGEIRLDRPDLAPLNLPPGDRFTPNVLVDRVTYDDAYPWPTLAVGHGRSLSRAGELQFGDSAESWFAATPSPGSYGPTGPRVTRVTVSGSGWTDEFRRSFGTPIAASTGYAIPSGAEQLVSLPWTNVDRVSLVFDRDVSIDVNALTVAHSQLGALAASALPSYDAKTFTATWTLTAPIAAGQALLSLDDAKVRAAGLALDGEWANGWPAEISGNGAPGGAFLFSFRILPGDSNQDGWLDSSDLLRVIATSFTSATTASFDATSDLDGSGIVNIVDAIFARNASANSIHSAAADAVISRRAREPSVARVPLAQRRPITAERVDAIWLDAESRLSVGDRTLYHVSHLHASITRTRTIRR